MARENPIRERLDSDTPPDDGRLSAPESLELVRLMRLPDEDMQAQLSTMDRAKRRRFQRALEDKREEQEKHGKTTVTKAHLAWVLGKYTDRQVMPLANEVDLLKAFCGYLALPFYERWWVDLRRIVKREIPEHALAFLRWLDSKGIRMVRTTPEPVTEPEPDAPTVERPAPAPRSAIEVVSR